MKPPYFPVPAFTPRPPHGHTWAGVARIAAVVALCGLCYQAGRWTRGLEIPVEAPSVPTPAIAATTVKDFSDLSAPGHPAGEQADQITPLNVRDPTALIMGPGSIDVAQRVPPPSERTSPPPGDDEAPIHHDILPKPDLNY